MVMPVVVCRLITLTEPNFIPESFKSDLTVGVKSSTEMACLGGPSCDVGIFTSKYLQIADDVVDGLLSLVIMGSTFVGAENAKNGAAAALCRNLLTNKNNDKV